MTKQCHTINCVFKATTFIGIWELLGHLSFNLTCKIIIYFDGKRCQSAEKDDFDQQMEYKSYRLLHFQTARLKIMWEEKLVDPPIHYITSVNAI